MILHRKAGKTALALNKLIQQALLNKNRVFWYVAPTYTQAKEIVWRDPEMLNKYLPPGSFDPKSGKNNSELIVTFRNGSVLGVKGADNPDSLRGPRPMGTVLDEFEMMKPVVWEEILAPIVFSDPDSWVWFVGTPKPTGAHFEKLHNEASSRDGWFAMTRTVDDTKLIPDAVLQEARGTMTQAAYEQEYLCKWFTAGGVVFRGIADCIYGSYQEPKKKSVYQWGVDLARLVDWTVICGIDKYTHRLNVFDRFNQIDWNLQKARIEAMVRKHSLREDLINLDSTGVGDPIEDDLRLRGLNINGHKFTEEFKRLIITNLALAFEQRKLGIPNIPELVDELRTFGYEILPSGRVRYGAPEGFHDDIVVALALAWWEIGSQFSVLKTDTFSLLQRQAVAEKRRLNKEQREYE